MKKLKIVIVDSTNHMELIGGGHLFLPALIKGITGRGHEVHLVVKGKPNPRIAGQISESGAIMHERPWKHNGIMEDVAPVFAKWVNAMKPDVYVVSSSFDIGWVALPLLDASIPAVTIAHSNADGFYLPTLHYGPFITTAVGVSNEICEKYISVSKLQPSQVKWVPYGVRAAATLPEPGNEGPLRMIYAGRIEEGDKRISDVAAIILKLEKRGMDFKFTIAGDGSLFETIKQKLAGPIASGNVNMTGWVEGDAVLNMLGQHHIFILTSSSEGFSIALTEAMANGCCPVVTDIPSGSVQLIRNGQSGYLLPVGDIDAFAEKLDLLNIDRALLNELRQASWETGREFSTDRMAETYITCFVEAKEKIVASSKPVDPAFPLMDSCRSKYPNWIRRLKFFAERLRLIKAA